ncbi:MAG: hypothetical protein GPJ21_13120 [Microcystis aeruginosa W13-11]|nr:hypothetical protein [Microcystis aeruginosa W13-11]
MINKALLSGELANFERDNNPDGGGVVDTPIALMLGILGSTSPLKLDALRY